MLLLFISCQNITVKDPDKVDKIENIDMRFSNDGWWHESYIKITNDSIFILINEDDSIGDRKFVVNRAFLNLFDTLVKKIDGNFIDTNYKKCDNGNFGYRILIKRNNSTINYYGGPCRKHEELDKFVDTLIKITSKPDIENTK